MLRRSRLEPTSVQHPPAATAPFSFLFFLEKNSTKGVAKRDRQIKESTTIMHTKSPQSAL